MKRMSILLALILMLAMIPMSAMAVEVGSSATLAELQGYFSGGGTITLTGNIDLGDIGSETLTIPAGTTVTLDLKNHTLSASSSVSNHSLIVNKGTLIVNAASTNGKLDYTYTGPAKGSDEGNYTVRNGGTMTVNNGTIIINSPYKNEHTSITIDNNSGNADTNLTIKGGTISSPNFRSIRQFANSPTYENNLTITNGNFVGQVWLQSPNAKQNKASISISGGTFAPAGVDASAVYITTSSSKQVAASVSGGAFNGKFGLDNADNLSGFITGGSFLASAQKDMDLFAKMIHPDYMDFDKTSSILGVKPIVDPVVPAASSSIPKTGDESRIMLWASMLMLSGAAVIIISRKRRSA